MAWENSENLDFPWKYPKYPHIFCPASLVKFSEKWDTLLYSLDTSQGDNALMLSFSVTQGNIQPFQIIKG